MEVAGERPCKRRVGGGETLGVGSVWGRDERVRRVEELVEVGMAEQRVVHQLGCRLCEGEKV